MPWNLYRTHEIEDQIASTYQANGILSPADMDLKRIAVAFGVMYSSWDQRSAVNYADDRQPFILISDRLAEPEHRADFFHELCHPLRHVGCQMNMPKLFKDLQEIQAGQFQLYAAMPWFMIRKLPIPKIDRNIISLWSSEFRVPMELTAKRLDQIRRRILARKLEMEPILESPMLPPVLQEEPEGIVVTNTETERLLGQLHRQTYKRVSG